VSETPSSPAQRFCTGCGVTLTPGVRFCSACGTPIGGVAPNPALAAQYAGGSAAAPSTPATPWIVAGLLTVVAVAAVIYAATAKTDPPAAGVPIGASGAGSPPGGPGAAGGVDIWSLTPRERFTRLADRVTEASERGDTATVIQFTPMAIDAFGMLPPGDRDIDARYHLGMIQAQVGRFDDASAQADTIFTEAPNNLMGYFIKAIVADFQGNKAAAEQARADYRTHYDAEIAKPRDEYTAHKPLLEAFKNNPGPK
jgi:hypothetical protein